MSPRYAHGDYVLTFRGVRPRYRPNDIVVVDHPDLGIIVKRVLDTRHRSNCQHLELKLTGENPASSSPEHIGWQGSERVLGRVIWHVKKPRRRI